MTELRRLAALVLARLGARPDTEHEQAIVRLAIAALLGAYLLPGGLNVPEWGALEPYYAVFVAYMALAVVILAWNLGSNTVSHLRRCVALVADVATVTWSMWYFGDKALPLLMVYIWVTLANGFRFGPAYLLISLGCSLAGFVTVLATSAYWQEHLPAGIGLVLGHFALSLYVLSLVTRMFDALARAEAANQAKRRFVDRKSVV